MTEAMTALENRRVAAIGNIGILLEKLRAKSSRSASLVLIPDNVGLSREPMACVVPEDESRFRDTVNQILSRMMTGLEDLSGPYAELYYQWFGVDGVLFYPLTEQRRRALNGARVWLR
jgi:polar amino acid transport system substrate-binding protein